MNTLDQVRAAKPQAKKFFARFGPISGLGITRLGDGYALKVNFEHLEGATEESLPSSIAGVPVKIAVTGSIVKRAIARAD